MLWPSTRATWNTNVTMRMAYTAAETSVLTQATSSSFSCVRRSAAVGTCGTGVAWYATGGASTADSTTTPSTVASAGTTWGAAAIAAGSADTMTAGGTSAG